jgi:reactive intermediate/imine deaminase
MTIRQIIATPNAPAAIGTYSQAVRVGQTVYLSGQIPLDPVSMTIVGGNTGAGFELQVRRVFDNLQAVCEAAGGTMNHIVKVNVFLLDLANFAVLNTIMAQYFVAPYPARAAVAVVGLPRGAAVEIEAVMVLPDEVEGSSGG